MSRAQPCLSGLGTYDVTTHRSTEQPTTNRRMHMLMKYVYRKWMAIVTLDMKTILNLFAAQNFNNWRLCGIYILEQTGPDTWQNRRGDITPGVWLLIELELRHKMSQLKCKCKQPKCQQPKCEQSKCQQLKCCFFLLKETTPTYIYRWRHMHHEFNDLIAIHMNETWIWKSNSANQLTPLAPKFEKCIYDVIKLIDLLWPRLTEEKSQCQCKPQILFLIGCSFAYYRQKTVYCLPFIIVLHRVKGWEALVMAAAAVVWGKVRVVMGGGGVNQRRGRGSWRGSRGGGNDTRRRHRADESSSIAAAPVRDSRAVH